MTTKLEKNQEIYTIRTGEGVVPFTVVEISKYKVTAAKTYYEPGKERETITIPITHLKAMGFYPTYDEAIEALESKR